MSLIRARRLGAFFGSASFCRTGRRDWARIALLPGLRGVFCACARGWRGVVSVFPGQGRVLLRAPSRKPGTIEKRAQSASPNLQKLAQTSIAPAPACSFRSPKPACSLRSPSPASAPARLVKPAGLRLAASPPTPALSTGILRERFRTRRAKVARLRYSADIRTATQRAHIKEASAHVRCGSRVRS